MATPKAGLKTMPTGITKNEAVFNESTILMEALVYRGVVSRSVLDPSTISSPTPANGTIYLVPDGSPNAVGEWASQGGKIAVYYDGWRYLPPDEGLTLWVTDEAQSVQYRSGAWVDRNEVPPQNLSDLNDVSLLGSPSPADGERLVYNAVLGKWTAESSPALLGTIDLSVNNATTSEAAALQVTGISAYKHIIVTLTGYDPAEPDSLQVRLMTLGASVGATGIFNGYRWVAPTTRSGFAALDIFNLGGSAAGFDNAHCTIEGHWNAITPTVIKSATYDNDAGSSDSVEFYDYITNDQVVYDGLSFTSFVNTVIQGVITVYGYN